jgi:hypothetical protein
VRLSAAVLLVLALAGLGACAQPRSARCKEICSREAECQQAAEEAGATSEEQTAFDEGDCVAACAALERDERTKPNVDAHEVCLDKAGSDCAKVAACR